MAETTKLADWKDFHERQRRRPSARCNALAFNPKIDGYELMVLSVVGPSTTLKSIQAALNSRVKVTFKPDDIPAWGTTSRCTERSARTASIDTAWAIKRGTCWPWPMRPAC